MGPYAQCISHEHAALAWAPPYLDPGVALVGAPSIDGTSIIQPGQVRSPLPYEQSTQR